MSQGDQGKAAKERIGSEKSYVRQTQRYPLSHRNEVSIEQLFVILMNREQLTYLYTRVSVSEMLRCQDPRPGPR